MGAGQFIPIGLSFLENILNLGQVERSNAESQARAREAMALLDEFSQGFDVSTFTKGMPVFTAGGESFVLPGADAGTTLNFDQMFDPGQGARHVFETRYSQPYDYQGLARDVAGRLDRAKMDRGRVAGEIGAFFDTQDFNEYLNNSLAEIGRTSEGRMGQATNALVGTGLRSGRSLEDMQGDLDALALTESRDRGAAVQEAGARREGMQADWNARRASAQTEGYLRQGDINAALDTAAAGHAREIGLAEGEAGIKSAALAGQFEVQDNANRLANREAAMRTLIQTYILPLLQVNAGDLSSKQRLTEEMAAILAGWEGVLPQWNFGDAINAIASVQAAEAGKPEKQSPFSFGITL